MVDCGIIFGDSLLERCKFLDCWHLGLPGTIAECTTNVIKYYRRSAHIVMRPLPEGWLLLVSLDPHLRSCVWHLAFLPTLLRYHEYLLNAATVHSRYFSTASTFSLGQINLAAMQPQTLIVNQANKYTFITTLAVSLSAEVF